MNKELQIKLNNLPKSWDELTFKDYKKLLKSKIINDLDEEDKGVVNEDVELINNYNRFKEIIKCLLDVNDDDIKDMSIDVMMSAIKRLSFISSEMPNVEIKHKIKKYEEITFQNFIDYVNYTKDVNNFYDNFNKIIPIYISINEDEIDDLPAFYVFKMIESIKKKTKKSMMISIFFQLIHPKMMLMMIRGMVTKIVKRKR